MAVSIVSHAQVVLQIVAMALAIYPWRAPEHGHLAVLTVCAVGGLLGVWTLSHNRIGNFSIYPEPRDAARFIASGPYALIRHPMYTALMLMLLGIAAWNAHPLNWLGFVLVTVAVIGKAVREERFMRARFPEYENYRRRTRYFVPFLL
jgi:protein-S-isoprenylcysteine O-methyltransferase Ste14